MPTVEEGSNSSEVTIVATRHGPYEVTGDFRLESSNGAPVIPADRPVLLCRCGHSSTKPFCDGTHETIGCFDRSLLPTA